jgi:carotenoid isomerooxygenase
MFELASIMGSVPARWPLHPAYMHTFGITENYFVIVEQPLSISVPTMIQTHLSNEPMGVSFKWYQDQQVSMTEQRDIDICIDQKNENCCPRIFT